MPPHRYQIHVGYDSFYQGAGRSQGEWETAAKQLLDEGQAFLAHDLAQSGVKLYPHSVSLQQSMARALTTVGALDEAQRLLETLAETAPSNETLGLLGRVYKDQWVRGDSTAAGRSLAAYRRGFELSRQLYTGINAASMSWLTGQPEQARALAQQLVTLCAEQSADEWKHATLGEALLLLGDTAGALSAYRTAAVRAGNHFHYIVSSLKQLRLLAQHGLNVPAELFDVLRPPTVVVFSGHMLDQPGRTPPRFPPEREAEVRRAIDEQLEALDARIGYSSAACGADLLFIEAMQEREAEVNIILPFDMDDFIQTSVAFAGPRWVARFRRAIKLAHSLKYVTEEHYLQDDLLFAFTNHIFCSYARLRAQALLTTPHLLAVWDGVQNLRTGGTADVVNHWPDAERLHIVLLNSDQTQANLPDRKPHAAPEYPREIHTMLFADMVGYSHLQEHDVPLYLYDFLARVSQRLKDLPVQPEFVNTWGDAIFAVMREARPMVAYALALHDAMKTANHEIQGLPQELSLRIGLHAGPVYPGVDPFTGASNFYGSHVNRTARLEPVTLPGHVYATEQFVALLNAECEAAKDFPYACEYVGQLGLAKNFGAQAVYHVLGK